MIAYHRLPYAIIGYHRLLYWKKGRGGRVGQGGGGVRKSPPNHRGIGGPPSGNTGHHNCAFCRGETRVLFSQTCARIAKYAPFDCPPTCHFHCGPLMRDTSTETVPKPDKPWHVCNHSQIKNNAQHQKTQIPPKSQKSKNVNKSKTKSKNKSKQWREDRGSHFLVGGCFGYCFRLFFSDLSRCAWLFSVFSFFDCLIIFDLLVLYLCLSVCLSLCLSVCLSLSLCLACWYVG